jgi:hypothetical protein
MCANFAAKLSRNHQIYELTKNSTRTSAPTTAPCVTEASYVKEICPITNVNTATPDSFSTDKAKKLSFI